MDDTDEIVSESFGCNLKIMQFFGLYRPKKNGGLHKIYAYAVNGLLIVVPILATLNLVLAEGFDIETAGNSIFATSQLACCIFKFFPLVCNPLKLQDCIRALDSEKLRSNSRIRHRELIASCTYSCRRNFRLFLFLSEASLCAWAAKPFLDPSRTFPVEIWLPFEATMSPLVFYTFYLVIVIQVFHGATANVAIDTLVAGLACHATGQVQILEDNLKNLHEDVDEEISQICRRDCDDSEEFFGLRSKLLYKNIVGCIDHYDEILKFVQNCEETFAQVVFSQFAASVLVICGSCFQLMMVEPLSFGFYSTTVFIMAMLNQLLLYCYYGTTLCEESDRITTEIYMGKWYEYDVKAKKTLILLMERAKKPMIVRVGKIFTLSLDTFVNILRKAYSLLAVLENM